MHIDLIDPYIVKTQKSDTKDIPIELTCTDPVKRWFKILEVPYDDKNLVRTSQLFNQT